MILPSAVRSIFTDLPRAAKQSLAILLDVLILFISFQVALWFRFELFFLNWQYLMLSIIGSLGGVATLGLVGAYSYVLRYMSQRVAFVLAVGVGISVALITAVSTFFFPVAGLSRAVLLIYGCLSFLGLTGLRVLARHILFPDNQQIIDQRTPIVVYGAGKAGSEIATALRASPNYKLVAMLDDDPAKHKLVVAGLKVYPRDALEHLIARHDVRQVVIAIPSAAPKKISEIVDFLGPSRLRVRLVPSLSDLVDPTAGMRLRDVRVEDLLGRAPVAPISDLLGRCVTGRRVMVSGAGGSIGSELCRQILALLPEKLVLLDMSEPALYEIERDLRSREQHRKTDIVALLGSVRDPASVERHLRNHQIQTVYHAAAYKHVPMVEANVGEGLLANTYGTRVMAEAAIAAGVEDFVLISTDKAVRPTNVMGASKRLAEMVLQALARRDARTRFSMVRFGNVLGSSGSVVPLFRQQIFAGGPITLTHQDITRYFMTIPEAAQLVLQAGSMGESGSVFVLDMGEPVRIYDLASRMIRLFGLTVKDQDHPEGDIEIRISGLRPGEKLYEELLIGDDVKQTPHPRIMRANETCLEPEHLWQLLEGLRHAIDANDVPKTLAILRQAVPEYHPDTRQG